VQLSDLHEAISLSLQRANGGYCLKCHHCKVTGLEEVPTHLEPVPIVRCDKGHWAELEMEKLLSPQRNTLLKRAIDQKCKDREV
jgi:hypothetical protein